MYTAGIAEITPNGIVFNMRNYTCRSAIKEQWFGFPIKSSKTIPILYFPEDISTIIIGCSVNGEIGNLVNSSLYEGKRLAEYYEAMDCLKTAKKKFEKRKTREVRR